MKLNLMKLKDLFMNTRRLVNKMKTIVIGDKFEGKYSYRETCFGIVRNKDSFLVVEKNNQYSLVGGGIEENETYKECLKREFLEESGYEIKHIEELVCIDCFWLALDSIGYLPAANQKQSIQTNSSTVFISYPLSSKNSLFKHSL